MLHDCRGWCWFDLDQIAPRDHTESDWVPGNLSQAIDRVHRIGQEKEVHVDRIVFSDSLDDFILKVERNKKKMHSLLLNKRK